MPIPTLRTDRQYMLEALTEIIKEQQSWLRARPEDFKESPDDTPMIDVRLCVETDGAWCFRTGLVDYDQSHSRYCGAAGILLDSQAVSLLDELLEQVTAQIYDSDVAVRP